jgi:hypothetical protein
MVMHRRIPWVMSRCSMCKGWGSVPMLSRNMPLEIPDPPEVPLTMPVADESLT